MSSPSVSVIDSQRPRLHVAPPAATSYADLAAQFASDYGLTPDPWQRLVLEDWLAEDEHGRYSALTCGLACSRQNGKNGIIEIRELFGMVGRGERILHTAHEVKTARKAFKRLQHFFGRQVNDLGAKFPELNALVAELRNVNGQEAIILTNGGSVEIVARSKGSGRGFTVDVLVMDEAQDLSDDDLEALMPTTSAAPLGNPQWIFTGTPPGPRTAGEVFTRTRADALSGSSVRTAWHEWSIDSADLSDVDLDDQTLWHATNPALGERLQLEVILGERGRFSDEGFARERLGWWRPVSRGGGPFDLTSWRLAASPNAPRGSALVWGVDVDEDRTASVVVAWQCPDGAVHGELGSDRVPAHAVVERLTDLVGKHGGRVAAPPFLVDDLERAGLTVVEVPSSAWPAACNGLIDALKAGRLRHGNQEDLNTAAAVAPWGPTSTAGVRSLRLRDAPGASPIFSLVRAHYALTASTSRPGRFMSF